MPGIGCGGGSGRFHEGCVWDGDVPGRLRRTVSGVDADQGGSPMIVARKTGWSRSGPRRLQCLGWWWTRLKLWLGRLSCGWEGSGKGGVGRM